MDASPLGSRQVKEAPEIVGAGLELRRPSFHVGELRRVGDLYLDYLARTIRNGEIAFANPVWSEDAALSLSDLGERLSGALLTAIRSGAFSAMADPAWCDGVWAIKHVLGTPRVFLEVVPIAWGTKFTEPQFTSGLAHFLNASGRRVRIERVHAMLTALGVQPNGRLHDVEATAEARTEERRRVDLLIEWSDGKGQRHAAAVEAKIGHQITEGQLKAYRDHLCERKFDGRHLVVVTPRRTEAIDDALRHNREWGWISWRGLLLAHERLLRADYDDEAYRRFRSTLWDQVA